MNILKQIYWKMKGKGYRNIDVKQFEQGFTGDDDAVVIDVRTPSEKVDGDIPGSVQINLMAPEFAQKIAELDKEKSYYVYCRSGNRSGTACGYMASQGFEKLFNLEGGIIAWNRIHNN